MANDKERLINYINNNHNYCDYGYHVCNRICKDYINYTNKYGYDKIITRLLIKRLCIDKTSYKCYTVNECKELLLNIVSSSDDNFEDICYIVNTDLSIAEAYLQKYKLTDSLFITNIEFRYDNKLSINIDINSINNDKIIITSSFLEKLASNGYYDKLFSLIAYYKCNITQECLYNIISTNVTLETFKKMILYGCKVDKKCLELSIEKYNYILIEYIINSFTELFTNELIPTLFNTRNNTFINKILNKIIKNGYKLTYDDIISSVKHHIVIYEDISHINLDDNFLIICADSNFYPKYNYTVTLESLEYACSKHVTLNNIKILLQQNKKLIPSEKCMINACSKKNNQAIIKTLIDHGGKITIKCLEASIKTYYRSSMIDLVINNFITHNNIKLNIDKEEQEEELEQELEQEQELDKQELEEDIIIDKYNEPESEQEDNNKSEEFVKEILKSIDEIDIEMPKSLDKEYVIDSKLRKLLHIKKNIKITFGSFRTNLISYLRKNMLIEGQYISLDNSLEEYAKIKEKKIKIDKLEKLLCLILSNQKD